MQGLTSDRRLAETCPVPEDRKLSEGRPGGRIDEARDADEPESGQGAATLLESAFAENPLPIIVTRLASGEVVEINRAFLAYLETTREEILGRSVFEVGLWPDREARERLLAEIRREGAARRFPFQWTGPRGEPLDFLLSCNVIEVRGERCLLTAAEDVTDVRRARRELEQSERRFALAFRHNPSALSISRLADGVFVDVNEAFAEVVGIPREKLIGRSSEELGLWPDPEERRRAFAPIVRDGFARRIPARVIAGDGRERRARISGLTLELGGEACILIQAEDVTELEVAQRELERSQASFRAALDGSLDAFFLLEAVRDESGLVVDFELAGLNRGAVEMTRLDQASEIGSRLRERCPIHRERDLFERYRRALEEQKVLEGEFEFVDTRGRRRWMRQQLVPLESGIAIWAREITEQHEAELERRRLETDFHRGQRLDSLGLLAGGVAHDFNNLLTAILGHAELAERRLERGSTALKPLRDLKEAAGRAAELTQKMLAFAGGGALEVEWVSLNEIVEEMVGLARPSLPAGRTVELDLARPAPGFEADATQMRQVVINLVLNASEAIEEEEGTIRVTTGEVSCERERLGVAILGAEAREGRYALLCVEDDGSGMSSAIRERIFEPFFTTRFTGRGLGLAAVLGIVRAHRGVIELETEPGRGTRITVLLPIARPRD